MSTKFARVWYTIAIAILLPLGSLYVASLFVRGGTEGLLVFLLCELEVMIIVATSVILAKLDKFSRKIDEKETDK